MTPLPLPEVIRVHTDRGSHIEPELDPEAPEADKLAWCAAITALDIGVDITVYAHPLDNGQPGYALGIGRVGTSAMPYRDAWTYLNGVSTGALAHQSR